MLFALILFVIVIGFLILKSSHNPTYDKPLETLAATSEIVIDRKGCIFCGNRGGGSAQYLQRYIRFDMKSLSNFGFQGYMFPFCEHHDPIRLPSPFSPSLQKILDQGRESFAPKEHQRLANQSSDSKTNLLTGQFVGQMLGGVLGGAVAGAVGMIIAKTKNSAEGLQQYYARQGDLLLRINVIQFQLVEKSGRISQLSPSTFDPLFQVLDETESHLKDRLELLSRITTSEEIKLSESAARGGLLELSELKIKAKKSIEQVTVAIQKSKALEEQFLQKLVDLKSAVDAGLISQESYVAQEAELKRRAG